MIDFMGRVKKISIARKGNVRSRQHQIPAQSCKSPWHQFHLDYGTKGSILAEGTLGQSNLGKVEVIISDQGAYDAKQDRPLEVATKKLAANTN